MITVQEALGLAFSLAPQMPLEHVALRQAAGRVLLESQTATRDQPPFASSAMDGYALRAIEAEPGAMFKVIGQAAAGARFSGVVGPGQAVRIFTGALVPKGADRIIIQEDVDANGSLISLRTGLDENHYVRPAGGDFESGALFEAPRRLSPGDIALLAAMNKPTIAVARKPVVAIISTGNELVQPGQSPSEDQIISSNALAIAAIAEGEGAHARILPIARDNRASLTSAFALAEDADLIVTSGGASVGDHDLIAPVTEELGMERSFYKVAMRPGKPLMAGKLGDAMVLGLPGNPVSSIVCSHVFMRPLLRAMQGLPARALPIYRAPLSQGLRDNGPREHYMRAILADDGTISAASRQDSSLLTVMAKANALIRREPDAKAAGPGELVEYIAL